MAKPRDNSIQRILGDIYQGAKSDFAIDRGDRGQLFRDARELQGKNINAPKITSMLGANQMVIRARELTGTLNPGMKSALEDAGLNLRGSKSHKIGQILGTIGGDLVQDTTRSVYWLLNAPQATGEVINELALAKTNPDLYDRTLVRSNKVKTLVNGKKEWKPLNLNDEVDRTELFDRGIITNGMKSDTQPRKGFKVVNHDSGERFLTTDNYPGGNIQALAVPTGIAINAGMGLMTPTGGYEGYKAVLEDPDDPSKTSNIVGEVAMKYIIGRTGNLLPYDEFHEVRPDVSRGEYNKYQAFKYDKSEDYNPLDGDLSIGAGTLRYTNEGIHGPEIQMLGRSLPLTTAVVPFAASLAGGIAGAKIGGKRRYTDNYGIDRGQAVMGGFAGGMLGLAAGMAGGHTIEGERRRRNGAANGELPMG